MRACVLLLALAACAEQYHVRLEPPRPGITPAERVQLFWQRRATSEGVVTSDREWVNQTLFLGDKQAGVEQVEVVSPEDLEPLVGRDSETMQYARRSVVARKRARWWSSATWVALIGGAIAGIALDESGVGGSLPWGWITFGASAVTASVTYSVARRATREELRWRKQAFVTYTRDLGLRLDVCAHGTQVVPCEADVNAPDAPSPSATAAPGRTAMLRMR